MLLFFILRCPQKATEQLTSTQRPEGSGTDVGSRVSGEARSPGGWAVGEFRGGGGAALLEEQQRPVW